MDIIKLLSDSAPILENTLCALSLYVVTTAFVFMAKQGSASTIQHLGVTVSLMEKISPTHKMTRVFVHQVFSDINLSGIGAYTHIPTSDKSEVRTNQTTPLSGSVSSHNTTHQDAHPSSMKQRNLAAWAVEEDAGSLAWDCFSALLSAAKHNASAPKRMSVLNRDRCHVSSIGHDHPMANDITDTVSSHGRAMMGNQLIDTNEVSQDHPFLSTLTTDELTVPDDPFIWAESLDSCDNGSEWIFHSASYSGSARLGGMATLLE
ncbi:hypothetical protein CEP53_006601 [Fusarium sp. AF-6]|nr:hypothetical protein CEP53_006601 [Fusarium sp. AF-6]